MPDAGWRRCLCLALQRAEAIGRRPLPECKGYYLEILRSIFAP